MTYRDKMVELLQDTLGVESNDSYEVMHCIEQAGYIPCAFDALNAPEDIEDWDDEIVENEMTDIEIFQEMLFDIGIREYTTFQWGDGTTTLITTDKGNACFDSKTGELIHLGAKITATIKENNDQDIKE